MGTIGRKLYGNDYASDVKGTYETVLALTQDPDKAYKYTMAEYEDEFDDEEPLFWYALADQQLKYGVLNNDVKNKALNWIERQGGIDCWEEVRNKEKWMVTLNELKDELTENPPAAKKYPKHNDVNVWSIGDVYALKLEREFFRQFGLYNKYVVLVKIGERIIPNKYINAERKYPEIAKLKTMYPILTIIDGLFDEIPTINEIEKKEYIEILDVMGKSITKARTISIFDIDLKYYPKRKLTRIGNIDVISFDDKSIVSDFGNLDLDVGRYILCWQKYKKGEDQVKAISRKYYNVL